MIDQFGLYVQEDGDGGDCPHRCGIMLSYWGFTINNPSMSSLISPLRMSIRNHLEVRPDVYIRYPITWNVPKDFSRDQGSRLMLGFGITGYIGLMADYYKLVLKNFLRHPNGDLLGFGEPGNIIRSLGQWYLYPVVLVLDLKFFVDLHDRKKEPWGYDCLFLQDLLFANKKYRTPWAYLAAKLYAKSDADVQITKYLLDPNTNGCKEAGQAMLAMFDMIKAI